MQFDKQRIRRWADVSAALTALALLAWIGSGLFLRHAVLLGEWSLGIALFFFVVSAALVGLNLLLGGDAPGWWSAGARLFDDLRTNKQKIRRWAGVSSVVTALAVLVFIGNSLFLSHGGLLGTGSLGLAVYSFPVSVALVGLSAFLGAGVPGWLSSVGGWFGMAGGSLATAYRERQDDDWDEDDEYGQARNSIPVYGMALDIETDEYEIVSETGAFSYEDMKRHGLL